MAAGVLTVQDVINRVQRTFGDESAAQVTVPDIIRWINDAQREAVMQNEGLLTTIGYLNTTANTDEYTLPTDLFVISSVYVKDTSAANYYSLKWLPLVQFSEQADGWSGSTQVAPYPLVYTQQQRDKIVVFPKPLNSVTQGLKIIYSRYAVDVVDVSSVIDLPPYLHTFVVNFCLMQAYEMDEDWESAQQKANQVQGDLDFNNNRQFWFGRETYPTISTSYQDNQ